MHFSHELIDGAPPCGRLFLCEPCDLTENDRPDLIVGGFGSETLPIVNRSGLPIVGRFFRRLEKNLFWYENPGWERHVISPRSDLNILGGTMADVTDDGRLGLIVGEAIGGHNIYWFEQPADPRERWSERVIASDFEKYHDLTFGDVDNDGDPELVGTSQQSEVLFYYDVPADPYDVPWPDECLTVIDRDVSLEGLEVVDLDGDGNNELIAGTNIYRQARDKGGTIAADGGSVAAERWIREPIATGWDWTRVAVGDLDDDGELEVVFAEGDSPLLGDHMGRVAWFDPPDWEPHVLRDDLYCPHTLQLADLDGNGYLDIYVAEMGLDTNDASAKHLVFRNTGGGEFLEHVVETGVPTHEAKIVDIDGEGTSAVLGKSYEPNVHVDAWYIDQDTPTTNGGD
ncbi:FG-GAP repeat domain-containing protein [Halalkalirubrum salinum]|uniref:FG-GAP repeat domain-containing protein n=1 Tax=Halalkalirubrum salinum TaxID=2563889 RepID=UPI0010FBB496|nr:VCBS repeat-containing protein [Halalkalirubrum salinum]